MVKATEIKITETLKKRVLKELTTDELVVELASKRIGNGVSLVVRKGDGMIKLDGKLDGKQDYTERIAIRQRLGQ